MKKLIIFVFALGLLATLSFAAETTAPAPSPEPAKTELAQPTVKETKHLVKKHKNKALKTKKQKPAEAPKEVK